MRWRQHCPVFSPVSTRSLVEGIGAAVGAIDDCSEAVESLLSRRYGALDALLTDSGTSALILALRYLLPRGGRVALPGYACIDLTAVAIGADVNVRLYDLNPATLSPDLDSVRAAMKRGVDVIVVAHLYGYPADVAAVQELAAEQGIPVIEDAAQAAGGTFFGSRLGSLGDIAILSFGRGKGTTGGSGGALLGGTTQVAEWMRRARASLGTSPRGGSEVARLIAQQVLGHPSLYRLPASIPALRLGEMVYHAPRSPQSMSQTGVAILRRALDLEESELSTRRSNARELLLRMRGVRNVVPVRPIAGGEPGYLRLAFLDSTGSRAPRVDLGAVRGYPLTLEEHGELRPQLLFGERAGKGAEQLRDRLFTVPTHSRVNQQTIDAIARWVDDRRIQLHAVPAIS
jgi:dTDP-4-amino-4,6-dideoxygalactose transaminase